MRMSQKKLYLAVMDVLEPMEKACLLLTVVGNMSLRECETVLKISRSTISRIIATAKKKARRLKNG